MCKIKFLVMDVDGTLTDGMIYMGEAGEAFKAFNIKDGCGIKDILPQYGIVPVIITARESAILHQRCSELEIKEVHQGCRDKLEKLDAILSGYATNTIYGFKNVAYVGDDISDIPCMKRIREAGGFVASPSDAVEEVKLLSDYVSEKKAGEGAVRDIIEHIIKQADMKISIEEYNHRIDAAVNYLKSLDANQVALGRYDINEYFYYMVQEYELKEENECRFEAHKKYVDIQWIVSGHELIDTCDSNSLMIDVSYDEERDVIFYKKGRNEVHLERVMLNEGSYIIIPNNRVHRACISRKGEKTSVRKIVGKVKVE